MLEKILRLKNGDNSVKEFIDCVRQGIPSAVFGVADAFKNYMVSALDEKDRKLIYFRYFKDMTQTVTAQKLGMTQVQVSRREKKLLMLLRGNLLE